MQMTSVVMETAAGKIFMDVYLNHLRITFRHRFWDFSTDLVPYIFPSMINLKILYRLPYKMCQRSSVFLTLDTFMHILKKIRRYSSQEWDQWYNSHIHT